MPGWLGPPPPGRITTASSRLGVRTKSAVDVSLPAGMENVLAIPSYDPTRGAVVPVEGGCVTVELSDAGIALSGDPAGLRDLAGWCMALADPAAPDGVHVHLDPSIVPLSRCSLPLLIACRAAEGDGA
jgi:hypothetical protein